MITIRGTRTKDEHEIKRKLLGILLPLLMIAWGFLFQIGIHMGGVNMIASGWYGG